ncbi:MAG: alpha/beta hydrolase [Planctomycetes bacterium]|nr:alpha/beta hydrolase [Planctomycetota bacterium]
MRALLVSLVVVALLAFCPLGCVTPPLVMSGGAGCLELGPRRLAWGASPADVRLASGEHLRGVWVPAGPDAPLVLHFLGSSGSVTIPQSAQGLSFDVDDLFGALRERGFASLAFDYRGVGASDGERDPRQVPEDALAMWNEALRRVDGDSSRITLRGMSLGTLALASLLERGAAPARAVFVAPVRAESAASNWVRDRYGAVAAWFASPFFARPMRVDLLAALSRTSAPLFLALGSRDALLRPSERRQVAELAASRGAQVLELDLDHLRLVHAGYTLLEFEPLATR